MYEKGLTKVHQNDQQKIDGFFFLNGSFLNFLILFLSFSLFPILAVQIISAHMFELVLF